THNGGAMTLSTVNLDHLVERARAAGLDGSDRGAVRRLIWAEIGSDAVDHDVVDAVVERLSRKG
ncbi:MAG TPA: hypothetical protein VFC93_14815, partial [Chloroflexota bacterium]|nr:hypothetical protein [Chloroflexota bacterium]